MEKVKVLSKVSIKPSSPTPSHLSTFKLSLLDFMTPQEYISVILFFESHPNHTFESESESDYHHLLKKSLSDVLTRYYPLAGKIKLNDISVDCEDSGVDYFETKVNGTISDFKSPEALHQLLPRGNISRDMAGQVPLIIQVNMFDCGGLAISVCMSHKVSDASTLTTFINDWAATTRGSTGIVTPNFEIPSLFPFRFLPAPPSNMTQYVRDTGNFGDKTLINNNQLVTKRFVFDATKVSALRARIADSSTYGSDFKYPTRVEAVSALIWKSLMTNLNPKTNSVSILNQAVNLRRRVKPILLPQESFGNMVSVASAMARPKDSNALHELVGRLRVAISKIDGEYVRKLQGDGCEEIMYSAVNDSGLTGKLDDVYVVSSWCNFPIYESDFGWGKPIWVTYNLHETQWKNTIVLLDTKDGEGIEAWVRLEDEVMAAFELNKNLFESVSEIV